MVADSDRTEPADSAGNSPDVKVDGGTAAGFDGGTLYTVIQAAVKDALLDVVGTLLLVGIAFVIVVAGGQALLRSASLVGTAGSLGLVALGVYIAAAALELIPSIRDLL
jgi:hypothetical protein